MTTIKINGITIETSGRNISVVNDKVFVDGSEVSVGNFKTVIVEGNVNELRCDGNAEIKGNVTGKVEAGGHVVCGDVGGNIASGGSVTADNIDGNIAAGGSVSIKKVR